MPLLFALILAGWNFPFMVSQEGMIPKYHPRFRITRQIDLYSISDHLQQKWSEIQS